MHLSRVFFLIIVTLSNILAGKSNLSAQYLQDTIKDLKIKSPNLKSGSKSPPSLNTLTLRRVYKPYSDHHSYAQSHEAISQQVDKLVDNMAAMISDASADDDAPMPAPPMKPRPEQQQAPPPRQPSQTLQGQTGQVPALHLTKAELAALYADAVQKGDTIKLDGEAPQSGEPLTAAVHELGEGGAKGTRGKTNLSAAKRPDDGYYYYYYPLKSFMDEMAGAQSSLSTNTTTERSKTRRKNGNFQAFAQTYKTPYYTPPPPPPPHYHHYDPYYHSHHHQQTLPSQHNVHIDTHKSDEHKKGLEPLFMAISGFIGMSVMFILSILVLPKFKKFKPKELRREGLDPDGEEFYSFGRVALEAIDGYDCTERFQCEAGKTAHAFGLYNNRFVKLLRRIGPFALVQQINKVGKFTNKKYRCATIRCKPHGAASKPHPKPNAPVKL